MNQDNRKESSPKFFIVDSQKLCMDGTIKLLHSKYPQAEIFTARNTIDFLNQLSKYKPDLLVVDIYISERPGEISSTNIGIQLLKKIL